MPRSYASRRRAIADSSECSPHQPVEIVQRPKPTSDAEMPDVPNVRVFTRRSLDPLPAAGVAAEAVKLFEPPGDRGVPGARKTGERVLEAEPRGLVAPERVIRQGVDGLDGRVAGGGPPRPRPEARARRCARGPPGTA